MDISGYAKVHKILLPPNIHVLRIIYYIIIIPHEKYLASKADITKYINFHCGVNE